MIFCHSPPTGYFLIKHRTRLQNKKDMVIDLLNANTVDVCGLQETEIPMNFPENLLSSGGFTIELENNSEKKGRLLY